MRIITLHTFKTKFYIYYQVSKFRESLAFCLSIGHNLTQPQHKDSCGYDLTSKSLGQLQQERAQGFHVTRRWIFYRAISAIHISNCRGSHYTSIATSTTIPGIYEVYKSISSGINSSFVLVPFNQWAGCYLAVFTKGKLAVCGNHTYYDSIACGRCNGRTNIVYIMTHK